MATSATAGVMNPLLSKLTMLLGDEYKKLTGVRQQASFLRDELSAMKALLDKMEMMDKLDPSAKNWRDHVREMSYDMENCIDDFMHNIGQDHAKVGFVKKMVQFLRTLGKRHKIANQIKELKGLAVEANARRERYKIDDCVDSGPRVLAIDPRMSTIYKEAKGLVGIDGPREELVSLLMDFQKKLKVVSIVGFGGLGKTTLSKQLYDKIGGQFNCTAIVSVSQRPDVKRLLTGLQRKLGMVESPGAHDLEDIIDQLREYLKHRRYYILVDDLWDQSVWNIISCAFPENNNGSRVMVTTRLDEVALWACQSDRACIYRMKNLDDQDSRRLFFNRVFGFGNVCPPHYLDISAEILKKCGGLPLAIITIGSMLASHEPRSLNEWKSIKNSLGTMLSTKPTLEEMRGILNLSYMHIPIHLRPCFLYLGMYPEDHEIERVDLIWQWIAEGFICSVNGVDLEDVAKSYFNDLINRSRIQPGRTFCGEVYSCRVHDMMLDLILSKSTEDNFITVAYDSEDMARLNRCEYKVRRLSLKARDGGATSETLATSMSQVRSYARFGDSEYTLPLSQFKYLRVLSFEFSEEWFGTVNLGAIGHLFQLRYLKVSATSAEVALPSEIQGLVHLEIMELECILMQSLPPDITCLANLIHLTVPSGSPLPEGIQNMKSIRILHCSDVSESALEDIKGLSELTNLEEFELRMAFGAPCLTVECVDALVSSIGMLRGLKHLTLNCEIECDDSLESLPDPPPCLEILDLDRWPLSRVPQWIGELHSLQVLHLDVLHLSSDEFCLLGDLPSLVAASFFVKNLRGMVVVRTGLFLVLERFTFQSIEDVNVYLSFEAGAMPKLQRLTLGFSWKEWRGATPVGMECLPCLQDIRMRLLESNNKTSKNYNNVHADVMSAFKSAASVCPRDPSVAAG